MTREIQYTKVLTDDSSFQLVRTNPKLTGNVKLTVNEAGNMWLNAIKANLELAKDDYAKFPIDVTQSLPANIYQFFKSGETPTEIIFSLTESIDLTKSSKDFKDQFDFSNYFSGVKYFPSSKYDEKLSYFAPLYLNKNLPNYFIILKIKNPLNNPIATDRANYENGQTRDQYLIELFKHATIIKTFDLGPDSAPGKYLRTYLNSPGFPVSPLTVSFNENDYTTWNGILVNSGVFGSKGELLYSQYTQSTPLKAFEENITKGFERNGVILPNILNMEFIFDDDIAEDYEFNRYLGLYVDTIELSKLDIDLARLYTERTIWPNSPKLRKEYFESDDEVVYQSNTGGVVLPCKNLELNLSEFENIFTDAETLYFNYLTDKDNKLHLPKLDAPYTIERTNEVSIGLESIGSPATTTIVATTVSPHTFQTDDLVYVESTDSEYSGEFFITRLSDTQFEYTVPAVPANPAVEGLASQEVGQARITLSDASIDLGKFFGASNDLFLQDKGSASSIGGHSHGVIKVLTELSHLDTFKLYHPHGTRLDSQGKYDLFTATENYALTLDPGSYYVFNDYDNVTGFDTFYFNAKGQTSEIAKALEGCLNRVRNRDFTAYAYENYVFIKCNVAGDFDSIHSIEFSSFYLQYSSLEINDTTGSALIGASFDFVGGSRAVGNRLILDKKHLSKIKDNFNDLLVRTDKNWSKLKKYSTYVDNVNDINQVTADLQASVIADYLNKIVLVLEDAEKPSIKYTEFVMRKKFRPGFGFISMLPIKDLDFDFYASEYLNFPLIDLYQHYFVPAETELLFPGIQYIVRGGNIKVDGTPYSEGESFTVLNQTQYQVTSGDAFVAYDTVSNELSVPIFDENKELKDFEGFSILKDPTKIIAADSSETYLLKNKYLNGLTETEYDFYKENDSKDFALRSKVLPYITKWSIKNGKDSRNNPYRLNTELVFGRNNFAPDHSIRTQNPGAFTHEWFYIESNFNYLKDKNTVKQNDYYFDQPFDISLANSDPNYFIEYFTYSPTLDAQYSVNGKDTEVGHTQLRYSSVYKNQAGNYETFFKGFKVEFKDVTDPTVLGEDGKPVAKSSTTRFEDYKFSCVLKVIKEDFVSLDVPPLRFRVIENKDYKFIVVVIEITLNSIDSVDPYWLSLNTFTKIVNAQTSAPDLFLADRVNGAFANVTYPFESVQGDYRFKINQDGVSNLTHSLLYSIKNKKYNTSLDSFSTTKLSMKFNYANLTIAGVDFTTKTIASLPNPNFPNYPALVSDEIVVPTDSTVLVSRYSNFGYQLLDIVDGTFTPTLTSPIVGTDDTKIFFVNTLSSSELVLTAPNTISPIYSGFSSLFYSNPTLQDLIKTSYLFQLALGGQKYYEKLFEKLSFARFKDYVNSLSPIIEYESYSLDSNLSPILSTSPNFYVELPDQKEVIKSSQIIVNSDQDKPTQFAFNPNIGYVYEVANLNNPIALNRYQGNYEPITKDLLFCNSSFIFYKNQIETIKLGNVTFNTNIDDLLTVKNFNHIKVADTKILTLETDAAYTPVYPLINEIAIGQADYFLLTGNWDWGFHKKYLDAATYLPVAGSRRVEEDENFMGKILNVPINIELEQLVLTTLTADQKLEDVDLTQVEMAVKENNSTVEGLINLSNVLTSYFLSKGIAQSFNDYLENSSDYLGNYNSIESYVKDYIKLNLLRLYELETAEFYAKADATVVSTQTVTNVNTVQFEFLTDAQRFTAGYSLLKTTKINKSDRLIIRFSIPKNLNSGLLVSPKIKIKFI